MALDGLVTWEELVLFLSNNMVVPVATVVPHNKVTVVTVEVQGTVVAPKEDIVGGMVVNKEGMVRKEAFVVHK